MFAFRCGYCNISESQCGAELTYDHFRPRSKAGTDDFANLVYACHACNEFKSEYWSEDESLRLLHPLTDDRNLHIVEEMAGSLQALSALGQIFIDQLQLNRPALVENRLERQRLVRIENHLIDMTGILRDILSEIRSKQEQIVSDDQRHV